MLTVCLVQSSSQSFQSLRCNLNSPFLPHSFTPPSKCGYWSMSCQSLFFLEYDPSGCVWVIFMFLLICLQCFGGLSKSTCLQILLLVAEHTSVSQANTVHAETTESLHTPLPPYLMCLYAHTAIFMICEHGALVLFELRLCYSRGDWINVIGVSMQWRELMLKKQSLLSTVKGPFTWLQHKTLALTWKAMQIASQRGDFAGLLGCKKIGNLQGIGNLS